MDTEEFKCLLDAHLYVKAIAEYDQLHAKASALDRIVEPTKVLSESHGLDYVRKSIRNFIMSAHIETIEAICDYLDTQEPPEKPTVEDKVRGILDKLIFDTGGTFCDSEVGKVIVTLRAVFNPEN